MPQQNLIDLREILGAGLLSYLLGDDDAQRLQDLLADLKEPTLEDELRLATICTICKNLGVWQSKESLEAKRWFSEYNPYISDAPREVIRYQKYGQRSNLMVIESVFDTGDALEDTELL